MTAPFDLVTLGLTTLDIAAYPVDALPPADTGTLVEAMTLMPAGTAGGCALVAAVLGARVAIASAVGADPQGTMVRGSLAAHGVDVTMLETDRAHPTSTTILPVRRDGQRPNLHLLGASVFADVPAAAWDALPRTRAVHWGAVGLPGVASRGPEFLAAARAADAFVTCDLIAPGDAARADLARLLPHVDLFMPSMAEVRYLMGGDSIDDAAANFMALGAGGCLFKLGADGALLVTPTRRLHVPAFAITPVDTTSCGDSFCAGFIAARGRGLGDEQAIRFAAATAALVAQGLGTLGKLTSFAATQDYAATTQQRAGVAA
jgi:sugar/nucleoside kinase (ribokinase family)